eukprot:13324-Heterococcus_DN1.PRE.3
MEPPTPKKAKKDKKDKKAAPAANEMAALAAAMADGEDIDFSAGADVNGAAGKGSNGAAIPQKSGKGGAKAARANALAGLDLFDDDEPAPTVAAAATAQQGKKAKKDKKKGGNTAIDEILQLEAQAAAAADSSSSSASDSEGEDAELAEDDPNKETLEEKIRKTRPPPRVRITESSQPGFVSMRLDSIAVTFRNQEVLTDASWEVKTGDRIGLVGPNGGGKTTQMKILAGELEPTTGEVILSAKALRVAFLKQELQTCAVTVSVPAASVDASNTCSNASAAHIACTLHTLDSLTH